MVESSVQWALGTEVVQAFVYNLGDADIWVSNISPHSAPIFPANRVG